MKLVRKIQLFILGGAVVIAGAAALQLCASNSATTDGETTSPQTENAKPSQRNRSGREGRVIYQDDFTNAAEQTVNGVVSVKSYATPHSQQRGGYGGEEYFSDTFLEFFF